MIDDGTGLRERLLARAKRCDPCFSEAEQELLREAASALSAVAPPPAFLPAPKHHRIGTRQDEPEAWGYVSGWNACRDAMLAASPAAPAQPEGGDAVTLGVCEDYPNCPNLSCGNRCNRDANRSAPNGIAECAADLIRSARKKAGGGFWMVSNDDLAALQAALLARPAPAQQDGVEVVRIERSERLDPITVYLADEGGGRGRMTIVCYNQAWTCYWGAMGNRTLREFVAVCDSFYVAGNMLSGQKHTESEGAYAQRVAAAVIAALTITSTAAKAAEGVK